MSVEATAAVWAMRELPATEKLVAVRIADHADPNGNNAYPSVARLQADTGLSERAVQGALVRLCDRGVLSRSHLPGPKGTRRYSVNLKWSPPQDVHPAADAPPQQMQGQDVHPPAGDAGQPPQQVHPNRHKNRKNPFSSAKPPRPEVEHLCNVLADLVEANGSKRPTVTKAWTDSARLMLDRDGRDPEKAERLIRWCQQDPFWMGNILSMPKFREQYDKLRLKANEQAKRDQSRQPDSITIDGQKVML